MRFPTFIDRQAPDRSGLVLFLSLLGLALGTPLYARTNLANTDSYLVRHWTSAEGLPPGQVQALCQTSDNYLWIGTRNGLARFNGSEFRIVVSFNVSCLASDEDGGLWVGTGHGLFRCRNGSVLKVDTHPITEESGGITAVCSAPGGGVWVTDTRGLLFARGDRSRRVETFGLAGNAPQSICTDLSGRVWMAGFVAPLCWNPGTESLDRPAELPANFWSCRLSSVLRDSSGALWFGEGGRPIIHRFKDDALTDIASALDFSHIVSLAEDEFETIWAGTINSLAQVHNGTLSAPAGLDTTPFGRHPRLLSNREGGIWVGTVENGLFLVRRKKAVVLTHEHGLVSDDIWSICEGPDRSMWVGAVGGLSHLQNGQVTNYTFTNGLAGDRVKSVFADRKGDVWVGTHCEEDTCRGSLYLFRTNNFISLDDPKNPRLEDPKCLVPGPDDTIWTLSLSGLARVGPGRVETGLADTLDPQELTLFIDRQENAWVGGPFIWKVKDRRVLSSAQTNGLPVDFYAVAHEDERGALWVLSQAKGIFRLRNGRFANISTRQGLWSDLNLSLTEDDYGRYWFNSYRGIYWVRKEELNAVADGQKTNVTSVAYGVEDGLLSLEGNGWSAPSACKAHDGTLWFPTTKGVAIVDPRCTRDDDLAPRVNIEEFRSREQIVFAGSPTGSDPPASKGESRRAPNQINPSNELKLPPGAGESLLISFSAPGFIAPDKTRYRFRLEGRDKDWSEPQAQPFVQLAGVRPGHFVFHVTACNFRGVWNPVGASIRFYIAPLFYEAWQFYLICGTLVVGVIGAVVGVQAYRHSVQRRIEALERETALARERERIARDMHDDLGAGLTRIARLTELAVATNGSGAEGEHAMQKISSAAGELVDSIGELVWATNPKYDQLESVVAYFRQFGGQYLTDAGIECRLNFPESVPSRTVSAEFRRQLFLVLKEALHNVTKHAHATIVEITLRLDGPRLAVTIADNGIGFASADTVLFHHGLENMRQRTESVGGKFALNSGPGEGTVIRVEVPLG